jgi:transposase
VLNKYLRRTRLSERKFRQVLKLFCADFEAAKIVEITNISRNTINALLSKIRARIASLAEKESYFTIGEIEIDESYFGAKRVKGKRGRGSYGKTIVFGMKKRNDKVYTQIRQKLLLLRACSYYTASYDYRFNDLFRRMESLRWVGQYGIQEAL